MFFVVNFIHLRYESSYMKSYFTPSAVVICDVIILWIYLSMLVFIYRQIICTNLCFVLFLILGILSFDRRFFTHTHTHHVVHHRIKGNVLFNDALKTFYLRLYGVGHYYGKGPFRERESKSTTRDTLFD